MMIILMGRVLVIDYYGALDNRHIIITIYLIFAIIVFPSYSDSYILNDLILFVPTFATVIVMTIFMKIELLRIFLSSLIRMK